MIYIDTERNARHTNVGAAMETPRQTWAGFRSYRKFAVPFEEAAFLLDYHDRHGDLVDTIAIDRTTYARISGEPVLSDAEYRAIDDRYWREARS